MASYDTSRIDADLEPSLEPAGSFCENDSATRIDTFADFVDRVLWSTGVLGLPCMWMPEEYKSPTCHISTPRCSKDADPS